MNTTWWRSTTSRAVGIFLAIAALEAVRIFIQPLEILIFSIAIAAAIAPLVSGLGKWMARPVAVVVVYIGLVLVLLGLGWLIIPTLVAEAANLQVQAPDLVNQAQKIFGPRGVNLAGLSLTGVLSSQLGSLGSLLVSLPLTITSSFLKLLLVFFISLYALIEAPGLERFIHSLFPEYGRANVRHVQHEMGKEMGGYVRGILLAGLLIGFLTYIGLLIIGAGFPLVLGLVSGLLELVPVIGSVLAIGVVLGVTLLETPDKLLLVAIFVIVLQLLANQILVPYIMNSQTNVSPLLGLLAVFAGGAVGGFTGALVAIPLAAAVMVLVREVAAPMIRSKTGPSAELAEPERPIQKIRE